MKPHPPIDEREWQAQERAMRRSAPGGHEDPLVAGYRKVAAAARAASPPELPEDFAAQVAALVGGEARAVPDGRLERVLLRILLALLPVALAAVLVLFGARWWQAASGVLGEDALRWLLVALACAVVSWGIDRVRAGADYPGGGHAAA
ncbi:MULTISPECIES: hypothetical protein [unclassified Luteimonas]|uniref:hypothetical protein n=1 Tax=unclassified Luteimonas TaxID=2629088 RepID=UPI00160256D9|nr:MULTISPECIES: hypothetical protein [unclassified Luteimonas]MBB1473010.1 hypothetical protein [Luteimonas sp. MC1782]MBB6598289.1 hypothetical protein [Luteimonas sp. MC1825]QOC88502.1 hypothetical protein IDM46_01670 [Luteimonas sp. MC1825]